MIEHRARRAHDLILKLLYTEEEMAANPEPADAVIVTGLLGKLGFEPGRLAEAIPEIEELLKELPTQFYEKGGGGWTFLNMCNDVHGDQWGEHVNMDELCMLAIGAGLGSWQMLEYRDAMPGGMPYFVIMGEVR